MTLFPSRTITHPGEVCERVKKEYRGHLPKAGTPDLADQQPWDVVDQASWDSFPASDAPPWTLGYTGPPQPAEGRLSLSACSVVAPDSLAGETCEKGLLRCLSF